MPSITRLAVLASAPASLGAQAAALPTAARETFTRGTLTGTVVAAATGEPVATASVAVRRAAATRAGSAADTTPVGGGAVRADGTFRVEGLRPGRYAVRVRALGYAPLVRTVTVPDSGGVLALGQLALAAAAVQLGGVRVEGEQAQATLAPDRNTYQTKDLPAASGGTAIDVLRTVPQVEVDAENNVSLRGSQNVTVQIDGRPTPLRGQQLANYLAQLPAALVAKVEVATNPSARNDPDGAAGIVNLVLTRRADLGTSGGLQAATSTRGLASVSGNVGRQQGRWTGLASYGFYRDAPASYGAADQVNTGVNTGGTPASLAFTTTGRTRPTFYNATLRGEVTVATHDVLAADAVLNTGALVRALDAAYVATAPTGAVARYAQTTSSRTSNTTGDYTLAWRHTVDPGRNALSVALRLTDGPTGFRSVLGSPDPGGVRTTTSNDGRAPTWRLQSDVTRALGAHTKLEAGVLGIHRRTSSAFGTAVDSGLGSAGFVALPALRNGFAYREDVGSAYGVLTRTVGAVDLQGGLRLERASTRFDLASPGMLDPPDAPNESNAPGVTTGRAAPGEPQAGGQRFANAYTSAFPSALVSYRLNPTQQVKVSYSRRVSRPAPQQLNPFVQQLDAYVAIQGNPALRPEYTDSYELGYQRTFAAGSVQLTPYFRRTPGAVRLIQTVDTAGVTRATFANVALTRSYGADVTVALHPGRLTVFGGGSVFGVATDARNVTPDVSFQGAGWNARGNATYKLSPTFDVQAFASYRAPERTEGGRTKSWAWSSLALRRKFAGDQTSVTLAAQDPFNTVRWGLYLVNGPMVQTTDQHFGARSLRISVSHNFGKPPKLRPQSSDPATQEPGG
jgi:outer membrane receptor protein involved in Fe transport